MTDVQNIDKYVQQLRINNELFKALLHRFLIAEGFYLEENLYKRQTPTLLTIDIDDLNAIDYLMENKYYDVLSILDPLDSELLIDKYALKSIF